MFVSDLAGFQRQFGDVLASSAEDGVRVLDTALARALAVHRNTAAKAARDALAANYPILRALCGDEAFHGWTANYIRRLTTPEARLNDFGEDFEAFLRTYGPARSLPYAPDVAVVERLVTEALFAADAVPLDAAQTMARLNMGGTVALHPATRVAQLTTPAVSIWLAHHNSCPDAFGTIAWSAESVLVTRPCANVEVRRASPGQVAFLRAWAAGGPDAAVRATRETGAELTLLMAGLIAAGVFA